MSTALDISGMERVAHDLEHGPGSKSERLLRFSERWPSEMAKFRRQAYRQIGLLPVPVNGSVMRGLKAGYFATRLRDGSLGYMQRRVDDCLQAGIATVLGLAPNLIPDLRFGEQIRAGKDADEVERNAKETMKRWQDKRCLTIEYHPTPPKTAKRWIGVVTSGPGTDSDHCLIMSGRDCLFDPCAIAPPRRDQPVTDLDPADIDYGITIEKK
jgi:hypothetical protein